MDNYRLVDDAVNELKGNQEQWDAVNERELHCVVLAGPGSGKTKTLTTAMARALLYDVAEPRGLACITYNNECAFELEERLAKLGVEATERVFIGTVHSFALSQVLLPYARVAMPELPQQLNIATELQCSQAIRESYVEAINGDDDVKDRWKFAQTKRRTHVDRERLEWYGQNEDLAHWIEAYEALLHEQGLIDFDDMPLLAYQIVKKYPWVRKSLRAKFPIIFVDEYQDLGHVLHELVLLLCFDSGIRLFAVGDPDQSIYGFLNADPQLLRSLSQRDDVKDFTLKLNYRSGYKIVAASMVALGEGRGYRSHQADVAGDVHFVAIPGDITAQAEYVMQKLIPDIATRFDHGQIAILYRSFREGDALMQAAQNAELSVVRADKSALVKRGNRVARWAESAASWVCGGWKDGQPTIARLSFAAMNLVYAHGATHEERHALAVEIAGFLRASSGLTGSTNQWLRKLQEDLIVPWRSRSSVDSDEWDSVSEMIARTDDSAEDTPLDRFCGRASADGRIALSTLHSAKGREFDAVVLFAMNNDVIPNYYEQRRPAEARRLFYVGVTRAAKELHLAFRKGQHSPWVKELYEKLNK